jgi:hypothetical protein
MDEWRKIHTVSIVPDMKRPSLHVFNGNIPDKPLHGMTSFD